MTITQNTELPDTAQYEFAQELVQINKSIKKHSRELRQNWFYNKKDKDQALAHRIFTGAYEATVLLLELPEVEEDTKLSESATHGIGKAIAVAIHVTLSRAYNFNKGRQDKTEPKLLHSALTKVERQYELILQETRYMCRSGKIYKVQPLLEAIIELARNELKGLNMIIGGLPAEKRIQYKLGLRASILSRKCALLAAATIHLAYRFTNKRKFNGIVKVANNREKLMRPTLPLLRASRKLADKTIEKSYHFVATLENVAWVERPQIPYSKGDIKDNDIKELRIHRKNALRLGICDESLVYTYAKLEGSPDNLYLVSEMEGPGNTDHIIWEDYLAFQLKDIYNLYPGSLHMEWEFPTEKALGAKNDLISRL